MHTLPELQPTFFVAEVLLHFAQSDSQQPEPKAAASDPVERWEKYFASGKVQPETLRQLVADLSAAHQVNEVVALLEQAIIHGYAQPWMYEVLALSLEIAGRPRVEIERVLLSSQDLTPPDAESLLFLAAYLARFERFPQAIQCCRLAADLESTRPEPYAAALRYARRIQDDETTAWSALQVLKTAWAPDQQALRIEAKQGIDDVQAHWKQAGQLWKSAALQAALQASEHRDLQLRLDWTGAGDLDLEITEPSGTVCSRTNVYSTGGGIYRHDGSGPLAARSFDEYVCPIAWTGEYRVRILHSWGNIVGKRATLTVTRAAGTAAAVTDVLPVQISAAGTEVRITLPDGRRDTATVARPKTPVAAAARLPRTTILQQLQAGGGQPFNVGATPVAGGGAVGYQPVIQFINEGVMMSTQAVISGDRRYVRITTSPVFSNITDVFTFSFIQ